jgi:hypothetical protein
MEHLSGTSPDYQENCPRCDNELDLPPPEAASEMGAIPMSRRRRLSGEHKPRPTDEREPTVPTDKPAVQSLASFVVSDRRYFIVPGSVKGIDVTSRRVPRG